MPLLSLQDQRQSTFPWKRNSKGAPLSSCPVQSKPYCQAALMSSGRRPGEAAARCGRREHSLPSAPPPPPQASLLPSALLEDAAPWQPLKKDLDFCLIGFNTWTDMGSCSLLPQAAKPQTLLERSRFGLIQQKCILSL